MHVYWTDRARLRLRHVYDYLQEEATLAIAKRTIEQLIRRSRTLNTRPHKGRRVPEYQLDDIREILERPYRIIYRLRPDRNRIDVLTVMHYRQLLPGDLNELMKSTDAT